MERKIIQLSDIHFGDLTFSTSLKINALKQIEDENPDPDNCMWRFNH